MTTIAFIGAGSIEFTRKLVNDILLRDELADCTLALHDIDQGRLDAASNIARSTVRQLGREARVIASLDRREVLAGADYVINMIQVGGYEATLADFEVPARFGVRQTIADTLGIGGIFRALRTIPVMQSIAADMHELCPDAWLLNYTNPMAMLCWATYAGTPVQKVVGLCHSVQGTTQRLARWADVPYDEVTYLCAGINHQSHVLRFEHRGRDLYPSINARLEADAELQRTVRVALYEHVGYFQTESSEHASEYGPWFLRHDDQVEHFRIPIDEYLRRSRENLETYEQYAQLAAAGEDLPPLDQSVEYAAEIIHAMETNTPTVIYGNVRNEGLITNLPADCCVEVPCLVDGAGVQPTAVGDLPVQLAALNRQFANVCELTVQAALEERADHIVHAAMLDPNTSAHLTLEQTAQMCNELAIAHGDLLPAYARQGARSFRRELATAAAGA